MGFWKKLFSKTKENEDSQVINESTISSEPIEEMQKLKYDENGWLIYQNGIRFRNNYDETRPPIELYEELGYKYGELYVSFHNSEGRGMEEGIEINDLIITCYWELFTNKLVCITRKDSNIMTINEINECIRIHEKHIQKGFNIPGMDDEAMMELESGIKEKSIRQSFVEKCFNKRSENNSLSAGKYHFSFHNNYMTNCSYDGYTLNTWSILMSFGIDDYILVYKNFGGLPDKKIKNLINGQAECYSKIDKEIIHSLPTMKHFAYDQERACINYIAIAAICQQCDVSQELFLDSTLGYYVLLSKTNNNGITTTRINAYNNTITFYNGHSMFESNISIEQNYSTEQEGEDNNTEGFVYVMVNPSLEGMVKIGKTTRDPNDRVKELSSATGVPTPFILVFHKKFKDCHYTEKAIHQYLEKNGYRISENREFFKMPVTDAINVVQQFYDVENDQKKKQNETEIDKQNIANNIDSPKANNVNIGARTVLAGAALAHKARKHNSLDDSKDADSMPPYEDMDYDIQRAAFEEEQDAYDDFIASMDMDND